VYVLFLYAVDGMPVSEPEEEDIDSYIDDQCQPWRNQGYQCGNTVGQGTDKKSKSVTLCFVFGDVVAEQSVPVCGVLPFGIDDHADNGKCTAAKIWQCHAMPYSTQSS